MGVLSIIESFLQIAQGRFEGKSTLYHGAKLLSARLSRIYYGCYHFERALADKLVLRDVVTATATHGSV